MNLKFKKDLNVLHVREKPNRDGTGYYICERLGDCKFLDMNERMNCLWRKVKI